MQRASWRTRALALACLAIMALAYVGARSAHQEQMPERIVIPEVPSEPGVRLIGRADHVAEVPQVPAVERPAAGHGTLRIRVTVKSASDGLPIPDAHVLLAAGPIELVRMGVLPREELVSCQTDNEGMACLDVTPLTVGNQQTYAVWAKSKRAFSPVAEVIPAGQQDVTLTLRDGLRLFGRVEDAAGNPVSGIEIEARSAGLGPPTAATEQYLSVGARRSERTKSGIDGYFEFQGLGPGPFDLWPTTPGWAVLCQSPFPRAYPSDQAVLLRVHQVLVFAARLVDDLTEQPVTGLVRSCYVSPEGNLDLLQQGLARTHYRGPNGWHETGRRELVDGLLEGVLLVPGMLDAAPTHAQLIIQMDGYQIFHTRVQLHPVGHPAAADAIDIVRVPGGVATAGEVVQFSCKWLMPSGMRRGPNTRLILLDPRMVINGKRMGDDQDQWEFKGVPAGEHVDARLSDGLGYSAPFTFFAGQIDPTPVVFSRSGGVQLDIVDSSGLRVFAPEDVRFEGTTADGEPFAARLPPRILPSFPLYSTDAGYPYPMPPGEYRVMVLKQGYSWGITGVVVASGEVAACRVVMQQE